MWMINNGGAHALSDCKKSTGTTRSSQLDSCDMEEKAATSKNNPNALTPSFDFKFDAGGDDMPIRLNSEEVVSQTSGVDAPMRMNSE